MLTPAQNAQTVAHSLSRASRQLPLRRFLSNVSSSSSQQPEPSLGSYPEGAAAPVARSPISSNTNNATLSPSKKIRIEVRVKHKQQPATTTTTAEPVQTTTAASKPKRADQQSVKKLSWKDLNSYLEHNVGSYNHVSSFQDLPREFGYNQHIAIDNELRDRLRAQLWKFNAPIKYAFAYGSGVFSQGQPVGQSEKAISLIFGVSYPDHWHSLNMRQHSDHYSFVKSFGSDAVSWLQESTGAGVYFNAPVDMGDVKIKYGVVSMKSLLHDLHTWDSLFLAGRLHKPVKILRDEPRARLVNQSNLLSAVRTALLILPEEFSEAELYTTIASLSFMGDTKAAKRENLLKVERIVKNQFLSFRTLYSPLLDMLPNVTLVSSSHAQLEGTDIPIALLKQDMDPQRRGNMVYRLPREFRKSLYQRYQSKFESFSAVESNDHTTTVDSGSLKGTLFDKEIAADANLTQSVSRAVKSTVFWPSLAERTKALLTTGFRT